MDGSTQFGHDSLCVQKTGTQEKLFRLDILQSKIISGGTAGQIDLDYYWLLQGKKIFVYPNYKIGSLDIACQIGYLDCMPKQPKNNFDGGYQIIFSVEKKRKREKKNTFYQLS